MTTALTTKPCPFCGATRQEYVAPFNESTGYYPTARDYRAGVFVECPCGARGPAGHDTAESRRLWDQREGA